MEEEKRHDPIVKNRAKISQFEEPHPQLPSVQRFDRIQEQRDQFDKGQRMNADEKERRNQKNLLCARRGVKEICITDGEKAKRLSHLINLRIKNSGHVNQEIERQTKLLDQMLDTEA